jgi:hypothetical protein
MDNPARISTNKFCCFANGAKKEEKLLYFTTSFDASAQLEKAGFCTGTAIDFKLLTYLT